MRHYEKRFKSNNCEVLIFDSLSEMIDTVHERSKDSDGVDQHVSGKYVDADFVGRRFRDRDDWRAQVESVWHEGVEAVEELAAKLQDSDLPKPVSRKRRRVFDELNGDSVHYDRLRSGQAFWETARRLGHPGPTAFTIVIDVTTPARQSWKDILWKGAAGIAITKILEHAGYRVELWAGDYGEGTKTDGTDMLQVVRLKHSRDPLNISSLSTAIAGWFFRSGFFGAMEMSCAGRTAVDSLGRALSVLPEHVAEFTSDQNYQIIKATSQRDAESVARSAINQIQQTQSKRGKRGIIQ